MFQAHNPLKEPNNGDESESGELLARAGFDAQNGIPRQSRQGNRGTAGKGTRSLDPFHHRQAGEPRRLREGRQAGSWQGGRREKGRSRGIHRGRTRGKCRAFRFAGSCDQTHAGENPRGAESPLNLGPVKAGPLLLKGTK